MLRTLAACGKERPLNQSMYTVGTTMDFSSDASGCFSAEEASLTTTMGSSGGSDGFSAEESSLVTTMGSRSGASGSLSTEGSSFKADFFDVFKASTPRNPLCLYFTQGRRWMKMPT